MSSPGSIPIQQGQRWTYVGPAGRKAMHTVMEATPKNVITYSDPFPKANADAESEVGGESWMGRPEEFRRTFRLANSCE